MPSGRTTWARALRRGPPDVVAAAGAEPLVDLVAAHFWKGASDVAAIIGRSIEFLHERA